MSILQVAGFSVCCACMVVLLRPQEPLFGLLLLLAGGAVLCLGLMEFLTPLLAWAEQLNHTIGGDSFGILLKALGIALVTQLAQDICKDAGAQTLAGVVELSGRVLILAAALPMAQSVLKLIGRLLQ